MATYKLSGADMAKADNTACMELLAYMIADAIGSNVRKVVSHQFSPQGVTAVAIIAESHISIHTFPEYNIITVDIFCCNPARDLTKTNKVMAENFAIEASDTKVVLR